MPCHLEKTINAAAAAYGNPLYSLTMAPLSTTNGGGVGPPAVAAVVHNGAVGSQPPPPPPLRTAASSSGGAGEPPSSSQPPNQTFQDQQNKLKFTTFNPPGANNKQVRTGNTVTQER